MLRAWGIDAAQTGAELAVRASGDAVRRAAHGACMKLLENAKYRNHCVKVLAIVDKTTLLSGLKRLAKVAKDMP